MVSRGGREGGSGGGNEMVRTDPRLCRTRVRIVVVVHRRSAAHSTCRRDTQKEGGAYFTESLVWASSRAWQDTVHYYTTRKRV